MRVLRALLPLLALAGLAGVEVREVVWGFDGTVVAGSFAPCEVVLGNPGAAPESGRLKLTDADALGGAPWLGECWLPPGGEQRLRFAVWIRPGEAAPRFRLAWSDGRQLGELPRPALGPPATVLLDEPGPSLRRARLPRLAADRFPADAALLDGLGCLAAAATPHGWEPAQAAALAAWVRGGGVLALLPGADLRSLAPGLQPGGNLAGRVLAVPAVREVCGVEELETAGWQRAKAAAEQQPDEGLDGAVARRCAELVRPEHPWALIRTVLILFALAIGVAWWLGRRGLDWRRLNLGLLAAILLTSLALMHLGRRGYGEQAVWTSIAILRPCGDGLAAAESRSSVFVTSGSERTVRHGAPLNLYACPAEELPVEGAVAGGRFATAIPLYSSRHLLWRGTLPLAAPRVEVTTWAKGAPTRLRLSGAEGAVAAGLWHGGVLERLQITGEGWCTGGQRETPEQLREHSRRSECADLTEVGHALFPLLALRAIGQRPAGRPCLLALVPAPAGLAPVEGLSEPHRGLALWVLELPETP